jgi:hypothetical protein
MALIFCDGFDHYLAADILKKWTGFTNSFVQGSILGSAIYARPPGGMGIQLSDSNSHRGPYKTLSATFGTFICGFAVNFQSAVPSSAGPIVSFYDSSSGTPSTTTQLDLRGDGAGHLRISRNGTALATSTNVVSTNTWYHVEIKATINNSTGAYEVKVNGSSTGWIPAATSQNTRGQSTNNYIDIVGLQTAGISTVYFDDFYFLDTTGSVAADFVGPQKIITIYPTGAGNSAQWAGNYAANFANVNELAGDGDTTFNQSSTAGHIDLYAFDDVPSGTISAIQHVSMARQDAGAARTYRVKTRISSTNYNGTTVNLAGSHVFLTEAASVSPATSSAWTDTELNGAEFGQELVS